MMISCGEGLRPYHWILPLSAQVDYFQHLEPKCAMITVQGADPGTARDMGAVRGYSTLSLRLGNLARKKCFSCIWE